MSTATAREVFLKDYTPPNFWVDTVEMGFDLELDVTRIATRLTLFRNHSVNSREIVLHGEDLQLVSLRMNGRLLEKCDFRLSDEFLSIPDAPDTVLLEIETLIAPISNTTLSGLYVSNENFFTQCEAEGFRRITFFPDRPDVMAKYTVMLRADRKHYPVLLSNGNLIESGNLDDGRHYAKWEDPFPKPSYLFALVAGKLVCQEEFFTIKSGKKVLLQIWVEPGNLNKTNFAMQSLKNSISWDEDRYGLELDLDRFMIVAVSDFNMGAMENKGLNIFNARFVLANPQTATDSDYAGIEAVVAHEYFHNWTGNRVTCRDWFQLSLKEGLTVFRDQEFSADMSGTDTGGAVQRIDNVCTLRQVQFPEDAGPMAHPVRPDSYVEINNFYTATVYEKGAEIVRMYQTLFGKDGFRKGMDLYVRRHDGHAVECDDFRCAMANANGRNLKQFERWYSQVGTPRVKVRSDYDIKNQTLVLTFSQSCPATPGQPRKLPFLIPIAVGLLNAKGEDIPLRFSDDPNHAPKERILELSKTRQSFCFLGVSEKPIPSLLRNFSAPVILDYPYEESELQHLFCHDSDPFNRWEAGQRLMMKKLLELVADVKEARQLEIDPVIAKTLKLVLQDDSLAPELRAKMLTPPSEIFLSEQITPIDPQAIRCAREFFRKSIAQTLQVEFAYAFDNFQTSGSYSPVAADMGRRSLKNLALSFLLLNNNEALSELAYDCFLSANNMTDRIAALSALLHSKMPRARELAEYALAKFFEDWRDEALVIDKWFSLQACAPDCDVSMVRRLMVHPTFTLKNPNRVRSLLMSFCTANPAQFHSPGGSGYQFWVEQVLALDALNPQIAARFARCLDQWRRFSPDLRSNMQSAIKQLSANAKLSRDVFEIVSKLLYE